MIAAPLIIAGGIALYLLWSRPAMSAVDLRRNDLNAGDQRPLTLREVEELARATIAIHRMDDRFGSLLVSIAMVESSFRPWVVGDAGASHGLMQTKLSTAVWLYDDLGYTAAPRPTIDNLKDPATSMYFGAAFVDWLSRYKGEARSTDFIMRGYNAGAEGALRGYARSYAVKVASAHRDLYSTALA